jgi:hypothetical protein
MRAASATPVAELWASTFGDERRDRSQVRIEQVQLCSRILQALGDRRAHLAQAEEAKLHDPFLLGWMMTRIALCRMVLWSILKEETNGYA